MSKLRASVFVVFTALVSSACGSSGSSSPSTDKDYSATLERTVNDVIVPTYQSLSNRASALREAVEALAKAPTDANLTAAKNAWAATRVPWEQSEGFLFGPVADLALDGALDSWPVDSVQLDGVLSSSIALTPETVKANLGGGLKGFHTIEYLLWGENAKKSAAALASKPRELEYLVALGKALESDTKALLDAWVAGDEPYGKAFYLAGKSGGRLYRQVDAVQQLLNGMIAICDEVANGKIADPFKSGDPQLVESQFSFNSVPDFADNIRSVKNIYNGALDKVGPDSLSAAVRAKDASLDARVRAEIESAIEAILVISKDGQPFREAIKDPAKRAPIEDAQTRIRTVMTSLRRDVLPLIVG